MLVKRLPPHKAAFIIATGMTGLSISQAKAACSDTPIISDTASFYSDDFNGDTTANGDTFSNSALTAAIPDEIVPYGTTLKVVNQDTGGSVMVTANDKGPNSGPHGIDLTKKAVTTMGGKLSQGVYNVKVYVCN